jgi:hypothetical protein
MSRVTKGSQVPKSPPPLPGKPWHWTERYFDVGEKITYSRFLQQEQVTEKVISIECNNFGRVSYRTKSKRLVFIEEIIRVFGQDQGCAP